MKKQRKAVVFLSGEYSSPAGKMRIGRENGIGFIEFTAGGGNATRYEFDESGVFSLFSHVSSCSDEIEMSDNVIGEVALDPEDTVVTCKHINSEYSGMVLRVNCEGSPRYNCPYCTDVDGPVNVFPAEVWQRMVPFLVIR
mgnify:CR=1 FL=1